MESSYLEKLGLGPGATQADVKRAYRMLSKQYHPDVSAAPDAEERFKEIHEAYTFLTRGRPTPHREATSSGEDPAAEAFERKRQEAREYVRQQHDEVEKQRTATIRRLLYWFDFAAIAIVVFNVLLLTDYFLPHHKHEERIRQIAPGYEPTGQRNSVYRYDDIYFEHFQMRLDKGEVMNLDHYERAVVEATPLLQTPLKVAITVDGVTTEHIQIYGLYRIFIYLIPAALVAAIIYAFGLEAVEDKLGFAVLLAMIVIVQLVLFFTR